MTNREKAAELRARGMTYRLIGRELGVSGERARQLLLPRPPRLCPSCGKPVGGGRGRSRFCRAPCRPPSLEARRAAAPRRKREEIAGPPRRRGRPRKRPEAAVEVPAPGTKKKGGKK